MSTRIPEYDKVILWFSAAIATFEPRSRISKVAEVAPTKAERVFKLIHLNWCWCTIFAVLLLLEVLPPPSMEVGKLIDSVSRAIVVSRSSDGGSQGPRG